MRGIWSAEVISFFISLCKTTAQWARMRVWRSEDSFENGFSNSCLEDGTHIIKLGNWCLNWLSHLHFHFWFICVCFSFVLFSLAVSLHSWGWLIPWWVRARPHQAIYIPDRSQTPNTPFSTSKVWVITGCATRLSLWLWSFDQLATGDWLSLLGFALTFIDLGMDITVLLSLQNCLEILCRHGGLEPERRDKCNRTVHDVATDDCKHLLENLSEWCSNLFILAHHGGLWGAGRGSGTALRNSPS